MIGLAEGVDNTDVAVGQTEQPVVGNDDEGVDLIAQVLHPDLSLGRSAPAFEAEGSCDDADGEGAEASRDPGHHGGAARARAASLSGGDEHHVRASKDVLDLLGMVLCSLSADLGVGSGSQTTGEVPADVELHIGITHQQRLGVGVDGDEFHTLQTDVDHPVDGVDAAASDADDLDHGEVVLRCGH